ncbi:MAG: ABC transporter substrate-binding protein [Lachnospiraceae bacterium]|nr:ABC transporter substrate-binding protein [Lachnospiraceae bacterium]
MNKRIISFLLAIVLCMGMATGCGNNDHTGTQTEGNEAGEQSVSAENVSDEKHLNVALFWVSTSVDPAMNYDGWVLSRVGAGETLVRLNMEAEPEACLADSWEQTDENTWVFHIREGVTFSNGKGVTAEACKNAIERAFTRNVRATEYFNPVSIEADEQTLTIRTQEPCGALLNNLCEPLFSIIDTEAKEETIAYAPVCTGPYIITEYVPDVKVELVKNENYWDGEPGLDSITVTQVADSDSRVLALQSEEVDLTNTVDNSSLELFRDESKYEIHETIGPRTNVVYMNRDNKFLSELAIRQAISYSIDRDTYAGLIGGEKGVGIYSTALACGEGITDTYTYDPEKAGEVLDAAGFTDTDGDGIREKDGEPIILDYYLAADHGSSDAAIIAQAIQSDVGKVGIQIHLVQTENMADIKDSRTFDLCSANDSTAPTADPEVFLIQHYLTGGAGNYTYYTDEKTDAMIRELSSTFGTEERQDKAREISQRILDDATCLYVSYITGNTVNTTKVKNVEQFPIDYYVITKDITME